MTDCVINHVAQPTYTGCRYTATHYRVKLRFGCSELESGRLGAWEALALILHKENLHQAHRNRYSVLRTECQPAAAKFLVVSPKSFLVEP